MPEVIDVRQERKQPAAQSAAVPPTVRPAPALPVDETPTTRFRVTWHETTAEVEAVNASEAWSYFCDRVLKKYPSPKSGKVEPIK